MHDLFCPVNKESGLSIKFYKTYTTHCAEREKQSFMMARAHKFTHHKQNTDVTLGCGRRHMQTAVCRKPRSMKDITTFHSRHLQKDKI